MRLRAAGVLLLAMAAVGTACTAEEEPAPAPEEPPDTPSPEEAAEASALEAYEGMWNVVVEASHEGERDPNELGNYASGDALALMRQTLETAADEPDGFQGEPVLNPEVVELDPAEEPETAELLDCVEGDEWTGIDASPESADPGTRQVDATVEDDGLAWRVSELRIWEPGSC